MGFRMFSESVKVWDKGMMEGTEFQTVGAAIWKERELKWRLMRGTYELAEEDDRKVPGET